VQKREIYQFDYDLSVVVFDEDMHEVVRMTEEIVSTQDKKDFQKNKLFTDQIQFKLIRPLSCHVQIKDRHSDKLGIYLKTWIQAVCKVMIWTDLGLHIRFQSGRKHEWGNIHEF